jgi:midasin (ATPase involved in ribosome maturation)
VILFKHVTDSVETEFTLSSSYTVEVGGIVLPHASLYDDGATRIETTDYVHTKVSKQALHEIAIGLSCGLPILLQGPQGGGKTSLIQEVARMIGTDGKIIIM